MERFSQSVREEIIRSGIGKCRGCVRAELAAIFHMAGGIHLEGAQKFSFSVTTEAAGAARRIIHLLKASYQLESEIRVENLEKLGKLHRYRLIIPFQPGLAGMLSDCGILTRDNLINNSIKSDLVQGNCCRASFLKGAFLSGGSITDPQKKTYHLELITHNEEFADSLVYLMNLLRLNAKISRRKGYFLVYLKEIEALARFLSLIEAHTAVIHLEEVRVIKSMRGEVNRRLNCETANLGKTLSAAWEQVDLIKGIAESPGLSILPPNLRQTAELRLEYPEATFKELGERHLPPISKSAVNHRLRLIREIARNQKNNSN
ncbi:MAG: DNA-binding protein WhiA [Firmicutes bacterium]|nr:DNA-binding protein WhiA [Bacillota bacterium]